MERLENLDVLRKVKKLWGRWTTTSCRRTAASSSFPEPIDDLPEEEFPEHFGMTKQDFEDEYGD